MLIRKKSISQGVVIMNKFLKKFFSIVMLASSAAVYADCSTSCESSCSDTTTCGTVACFPLRSQSVNAARRGAGMVGHTNDVADERESWWGTFNVTPGYQQTWKSSKIADCLFGHDFVPSTGSSSCSASCDDSRTILIQGSAVTSRNAKAWLADNFYLPRDFNGSFSVSPKIKTFYADLDFYLGLDEWWKGAYVQVWGPIVYTRWDLDFEEQTPTAAGTLAHTAGYFTPMELPRTSLLANFSAYVQGNTIGTNGVITQEDGAEVAHTITFQPLNYARMSCGSRKETGFGDLRAEFGWNFWRHEDYHMGISIQAAAPTGNKCCSKYLFDAVVGNGKHWELGGALTGHYVFYRSEEGDKHFGFYGDLNVTHMFKRSGLHTYDLKGKPNSKYMLAAKFGANSQDLRGASTTGTLASKQFAELYTPVANLTTVNVDVSSSAQIDLVAKFNYTYKRFSMDLGYNFYYRSCQDVDCATDCDSCGDDRVNLCISGQENTWALKGDAQMYGFAQGTNEGPIAIATNQAIPLSATESNATIHGGTNSPTAVLTLPTENPTIDNPQAAFAGNGSVALFNQTTVSGSAAINTSIQPVFLSCSDIDMSGTRSMSHGLFTHLQYNFERADEDWTPYLGVGAMVEFGTHSDDCDDSDCSDNCMTCTPSTWQVWLKGGVSFS